MSQNYMLNDEETEASYSEDYTYYDGPEKGKAGGYKFLSFLVFLVSVGGLFIGLLGRLLSFLAPIPFVESDFLNGTLLGSIIAVIKDLFAEGRPLFSAVNEMLKPSYGGAYGIFAALAYYAHYAIPVAVLLSFILMVISLVAKNYVDGNGNPGKTSMRCAFLALFISLFVYGLYFVSVFVMMSTSYSMTTQVALSVLLKIIDFPTLIISGILVVLLSIAALARGKATGAINVLVYLLTLAAAFAFFYPQNSLSGNTLLFFNFAFAGDGLKLLTRIAVIATGALVLANLVLSTLRIPAKGGFIFDVLRLVLQLVAVIVLAAFFVFLPENAASPAWSALGTLPVILLAVASLAALLFSVLQCMRAAMQKKNALNAAGYATASEEKDEKADYNEEYAEEVYAQEEYAKVAVPEEVPAEEEAEEEFATEEYAEGEAVEEVTPEKVETPAAQIPAASEQASAEEQPMSDFMRAMHSLAKGNAPVPPANPAPNYYPYDQQMRPAPSPTPMHPYGYDSMSMQRRQTPSPTNSYMYDPFPYTYDPFIKTLTIEERNEFGDLYISCRQGRIKGLPPYVIGGDNSDFFRKVWIHYGAFEMSAGLKRKLHMFVQDIMNRG